MWLNRFFVLFTVLLFSSAAWSQKSNANYQGHFRTGMLSASFSGSGQADGAFSIPNTIDLEMEFFTSTRKAFLVRATMAMDLGEGKVRYTYGGGGQRYYFKAPGMVSIFTDHGDSVISIPKLRYYAGWDAGIAQVLVLEFGPVLSTFSTILEVGGNGGIIYQFNRSIGIEALLGLSYGMGFSSVTVSGIAYRLFLGGSFFF